MLVYQIAEIRRFRLAGCLVLLSGALLGCASGNPFHRSQAADGPAAAADASRSADAAAGSETTQTATEVAAVRDASQPEAPVVTSAAINPTAPATYTVKRGDTLWGIASMYLKDPWLWPEIWHVNPQVANPHLIYPGDVLALVYGSDGRPAVMLQQGGAARMDPSLRSSRLDGAIATIPYSAIAAFLERPSVVSKDEMQHAARIIAFRDSHVIAGAGHTAYVQGLAASAQANSRYSVVHVGDKIVDPDDHAVLGYQGIYAATAVVTQAGRPTSTQLTDSAREALVGDILLNQDLDVPLNFVPRAPARKISGQIISVMESVELIGQYRIVAINRGRRHGLESGNVLAIDEKGETIRDRGANRLAGLKLGSAFAPRVKLPNERAATLLVFKVFDRMSYGLVVEAQQPVRLHDVVRSP